MSWNYRIVTLDNGVTFGIHEVFYNFDGSIRMWTETSVKPFGDTPEDLREEVKYMMQAFDKPALTERDGKLLEYVSVSG